MSFTVVDYLVTTNEDWRDALELTDDQDAPIDLSGSTFLAHIRESSDSLSVALVASTENGRLAIADPPTSGIIAWNLAASELALVPPGVYVYDIVWTSAGDIADTVVGGTITVKRGITRT